MKFKILFYLAILISIGILCSCNDDEDSTEEIVKTPPESIIEVDPYHGYYELNTSFTINSYSFDKNISETDLRINWFTNNKLCEMCELEEYTNLSSFSIKFEDSQLDEDKRIDLIQIVNNVFDLSDTTSHTFIFENEAPVIAFKISYESPSFNKENAIYTFDLSNSTDAFGGKDLVLKLDTNGNGTWNYERAYENDSSFIITTGGYSRNTTTIIKAQIEDSQGNQATETKSIRLEHGIIIIT